jgi:hypothetical protein
MVLSDPVQPMKIPVPVLPTNKLKVFVVGLAFLAAPTMMGATSTDAVVGSTCLVPIYHTDFAFPAEGGKIVRIGDRMFFVQDYRAECADAGVNGEIIKGSQTSTIAGTVTPPTEPKPNCIP